MSADSIIVVDRRRRAGWSFLYLPGILRALWIVFRHFVRNLRGRPSKPGVFVDYPDEGADFPPTFRGMPVLVEGGDGAIRCVACGLCQRVCPSDCIHIEAPAAAESSQAPGPPERFELDMARCMFCGLCEEICPVGAIAMSPHVEIAAFDRPSMVFHESDLLVPAAYLETRLRLIRPGLRLVDSATELPPSGEVGGER